MSIQTQVPTIDQILQLDNQITAVEALPGYRIRLTYIDGEVYELDYSVRLSKSDFIGQLRDPAVFNAVKLGKKGRWIEWPNGYDNCADALRWDGEMARRGLTRADVSEPE